jgi:AcrR family transcriptional regulator
VSRGRPRQHDPEALLDHARSLWVEQGTSGLTIRALSARAGVGNGALYNAFGSRDNLMARVWAREARAFLAYERALVEGVDDAQEAVIAASLSPATYAATNEEAARLLLAVEAKDLINGELGETERAELEQLRAGLGDLIVELADKLWNRTDREAVLLIKFCLVELPGKLLLSRRRVDDPLAQHAVREAVRGITSAPPPGRVS